MASVPEAQGRGHGACSCPSAVAIAETVAVESIRMFPLLESLPVKSRKPSALIPGGEALDDEGAKLRLAGYRF
jgi:hypothetical protein